MTEVSIDSANSADLVLFEDLPSLSNKFDTSMVSLQLPIVKMPNKDRSSKPDFSDQSD
jgi:hypothetical protein